MRFSAIVSLAVGLIWPWNGSAGQEVNQPAFAAAMGVWGYITGLEIEIAKCREIDPANADSYDVAYGAYQQDVAGLLLRIDILLTSEAKRVGATEDSVAGQQKPLMDAAVRAARQAVEINPAAWLAACRKMTGAVAQHLREFKPLRERFPEDMRLIDEWR